MKAGQPEVGWEELAVSHLPRVRRLARRVTRRIGRPDLEDELFGAGQLGLVEAGRRFQASRGVQFWTAVRRRVIGAMLDGGRRSGYVGRRIWRNYQATLKARCLLERKLQREATSDEVREQVGKRYREIPPSWVWIEEMSEAWRNELFFEVSPEEEFNIHLQHKRDLSRLLVTLATLPVRYRRILVGRYYRDLTFRKIGEHIGVGESRASQLHRIALRRTLARCAAS